MNILDIANGEIKRMRTHDSNHRNSFQLSNIEEFDVTTLDNFEGHKSLIDDSTIKRIPPIDSRGLQN